MIKKYCRDTMVSKGDLSFCNPVIKKNLLFVYYIGRVTNDSPALSTRRFDATAFVPTITWLPSTQPFNITQRLPNQLSLPMTTSFVAGFSVSTPIAGKSAFVLARRIPGA